MAIQIVAKRNGKRVFLWMNIARVVVGKLAFMCVGFAIVYRIFAGTWKEPEFLLYFALFLTPFFLLLEIFSAWRIPLEKAPEFPIDSEE